MCRSTQLPPEDVRAGAAVVDLDWVFGGGGEGLGVHVGGVLGVVGGVADGAEAGGV